MLVRAAAVPAPPEEAKRTKRAREGDEEKTLDDHIAAHRRALVEARREAPALRAKAAALRAEAAGLTARWQRREALDTARRAAALEAEADARASMEREHEYEASIVTYLRTYHREPEASAADVRGAARRCEAMQAFARHAGAASARRAAVLDEYLVDMNRAPPKVAMAARDECPRCATKLLLCAPRSLLTCPDCGYAVTYLDATSTTTGYDEVVDYAQYSYKRVNHFMLWLHLCQGREQHRVSDDILRATMEELYRQGVRAPGEITPKRVRDVLRKLRLRKAYEHVAQVAARLSGNKPLRIPRETEEQLRTLFLQMQPAFERHAPKTRTNFLSYPYVLYRCFQILGLTHMLDGIPLLKGRDKLEANDAIFRKMCVDLGWPVFELPPTT